MTTTQQAWIAHVNRWQDCTDCPLCQQRDRIVLARGSLPADIVFVGEAPGASEDALGLPFIGPAGGLFDQIIERSVPSGVTYALTNLVACFPREAKAAGDNEPTDSEIRSCRPRLEEFLDIADSKLVVCVGSLATQYVPRKVTRKYADIVHPAFILRMPLAQKQMAVQRCVVTIRTAIEEMS